MEEELRLVPLKRQCGKQPDWSASVSMYTAWVTNEGSWKSEQLKSCDLIVITETLQDKSYNWSTAVHGYKLFRRDRQGRRGRGIVFYVTKIKRTKKKKSLSPSFLKALFICWKVTIMSSQSLFLSGWGSCALPSYVLVWPYSAMLVSGVSCLTGITHGNQELLCSKKNVFKHLPALFCSSVPEGSFPVDPIR